MHCFKCTTSKRGNKAELALTYQLPRVCIISWNLCIDCIRCSLGLDRSFCGDKVQWFRGKVARAGDSQRRWPSTALYTPYSHSFVLLHHANTYFLVYSRNVKSICHLSQANAASRTDMLLLFILHWPKQVHALKKEEDAQLIGDLQILTSSLFPL